jgi:hypothetical protein
LSRIEPNGARLVVDIANILPTGSVVNAIGIDICARHIPYRMISCQERFWRLSFAGAADGDYRNRARHAVRAV